MCYNSFGGGAVYRLSAAPSLRRQNKTAKSPRDYLSGAFFCVYGAKFTSFSNITPVYALFIFYIIVRNYASSSMFPVRQFSKIPSLNWPSNSRSHNSAVSLVILIIE